MKTAPFKKNGPAKERKKSGSVYQDWVFLSTFAMAFPIVGWELNPK